MANDDTRSLDHKTLEAVRIRAVRSVQAASPRDSSSGRLQPRHFRLELEAQLGAFLLGQPERHLRENGAV
jgi:hypothetical protein